MATNLQLINARNSELCADGRTALGPGGLLIGTDAVPPGEAPAIAETYEVPPARGLAPVVPMGDAVLDWKRLTGFLGRQPAAALDRMVVTVPHALADDLTIHELAGRAGQLGLPTLAWLTDVVGDAPGEEATLAGHRVQYLDGEGDPATAGNAVSVLVHPIGGLVDDPYAGLPESVVAQALTKPNPATRLNLSEHGVQIGLSPTLVAAAFPQVLTGVPAAATRTGDAALVALGVTATETLAGYAALPAHLSTLEVGAVALLLAGDRPFLITRHAGTGALAVLDPATAAPGRPPLNATPVRVATLAGDGTTLTERMAQLRGGDALAPGAGPLSGLGAEAVDVLEEWFVADGTRRAVEAVGAKGPLTDDLRRLVTKASEAGQSVLVLRPPAPGEPLADDVIAAAEKRIDQIGWDGQVPAVVNLARGTPDALLPILDRTGADLFQQDPGAATAGLFFLGIPWTVRHPGGERGPAAEEITADALETAGQGRRAALAPPTPAVARLLAQPLTAGLGSLVAPHGPDLAAQLAEVAARASQVGAYAGHDAVLNLAGQERLEGTLRYLGAENREHGAVLDPVLGLSHPAQITAALPHLATLAGSGLGDMVSHTVTTTLGRLMTGEITQAQAVESIRKLRGRLPATGSKERGDWTGRLIRMAGEQPAQFENISVVATAILECPDD